MKLREEEEHAPVERYDPFAFILQYMGDGQWVLRCFNELGRDFGEIIEYEDLSKVTLALLKSTKKLKKEIQHSNASIEPSLRKMMLNTSCSGTIPRW